MWLLEDRISDNDDEYIVFDSCYSFQLTFRFAWIHLFRVEAVFFSVREQSPNQVENSVLRIEQREREEKHNNHIENRWWKINECIRVLREIV